MDVFKTFGFTEPMVDNPKDWTGQLEPYYQRAAMHFFQKGITGDMVRSANGFWKKYKGRGTTATALAKLNYEGAAVPFGKAKAKAAPVPAAPAAPAAPDPKTMLTQAFLAGTISIEQFTQAIAALDGNAAKSVEAPAAEPEGNLDLTGTDDDLPF